MARKADENFALVLEDDAAQGAPIVFGGFPGRWAKRQALNVRDLGLEPDEARRMVKDMGLPLKETTAKSRGALSSADVPGQVEGGREQVEMSGFPGLTREEYDALVREGEERGQPYAVLKAHETEALGAGGPDPRVSLEQPVLEGENAVVSTPPPDSEATDRGEG